MTDEPVENDPFETESFETQSFEPGPAQAAAMDPDIPDSTDILVIPDSTEAAAFGDDDLLLDALARGEGVPDDDLGSLLSAWTRPINEDAVAAAGVFNLAAIEAKAALLAAGAVSAGAVGAAVTSVGAAGGAGAGATAGAAAGASASGAGAVMSTAAAGAAAAVVAPPMTIAAVAARVASLRGVTRMSLDFQLIGRSASCGVGHV